MDVFINMQIPLHRLRSTAKLANDASL